MQLDDPKLEKLAGKYGKSTAQILIKWGLQNGLVSLPKSIKPHRIEENFNVFDFKISENDMKELAMYEEGYVTSWDPTTWN